ncbi:uncharacterized protein LOC124115545 [Haliotis rufescens]|uniref:uncharacterized protein LOC124115545 n=1 Tax=Haliotis rufescens TaxID=6454 RepID=UPI001EB09743|nr:uncharacterized protein LOC124115545 [Haliotis rufescens]
MASMDVARQFSRPKLSCRRLFKSWFQTETSQTGHDQQYAHPNEVRKMGSATPEDGLILSVSRSFDEAPAISEGVMRGEGVQMATPSLPRHRRGSSPCCGRHKGRYNMIGTQPPGGSSALCKHTANLGDFAFVNIADKDTVYDDTVSPQCIMDLMSLLVGFGVTSQPVPYAPRAHRHDCAGEVFCKNLFLKDRRGQYYLVICDENHDIDLKRLRCKLKAHRNFSFGTKDEMAAIFHVSLGGLTPFALMHRTACDVRVVMTIDLATNKEALLNFHPLDANLTLPVRLAQLIQFLEHFRFNLEFVDMSC